MADLTKLTSDLDIISMLDNEPNDVGGLTAEELKAKFDEGANLIKQYINEVLIPELASEIGAANIGITRVPGITGAEDVQAALEKLETQMGDITQGAVADSSITTAKLADLAVTTAKLADACITLEKLADGIVTSDKLADLAVITAKIADAAITGAKIADKAVIRRCIGDKAVGTSQLGTAAVGSEQIDDNAVLEKHLQGSAVTTAKIAANAVTRAKLATDALYSPIVDIFSERDLAASDNGKTLYARYASTDTTYTMPLTQDISATLPIGYEIALCEVWPTAHFAVKFTDVRVFGAGEQICAAGKTVTVKLTEQGAMMALKKLQSHDSLKDVWLLTGSWEVVS